MLLKYLLWCCLLPGGCLLGESDRRAGSAARLPFGRGIVLQRKTAKSLFDGNIRAKENLLLQKTFTGGKIE